MWDIIQKACILSSDKYKILVFGENMDVAKRDKLLISRQNLTQKKFAESIGISPARLNNYLTGIAKVPQKILIRISEEYNCSLTWLLTGEGDMYNVPVMKEGYLTKTLRLPILGDIAAGFPIEPIEPDQVEYLNISTSELTLPPPYYVFTVEGESMLPFIYPGDRVVISGSWQHIPLDERICAFRTPDGITLKQYAVDAKTKTTWLFPVNSRFHPISYTKDTQDLTLVGVMILLVRRT